MKCSQEKCDAEATGTFIWPGDVQTQGGHPACERHLLKALAVARTMGLYLPTGGPERVEELERREAAKAIAILAGPAPIPARPKSGNPGFHIGDT